MSIVLDLEPQLGLHLSHWVKQLLSKMPAWPFCWTTEIPAFLELSRWSKRSANQRTAGSSTPCMEGNSCVRLPKHSPDLWGIYERRNLFEGLQKQGSDLQCLTPALCREGNTHTKLGKWRGDPEDLSFISTSLCRKRGKILCQKAAACDWQCPHWLLGKVTEKFVNDKHMLGNHHENSQSVISQGLPVINVVKTSAVSLAQSGIALYSSMLSVS